MKLKRFNSSQGWVALFGCPLIFCLLVNLESPLETRLNRHGEVATDEASYQLTPAFFKFVSFGFWPAAVDSLWISTIQSVGSYLKTPEEFAKVLPQTRSFYELATDLDPYFYELYEQASVFFSVYGNAPFEAVYFLEKGIQVYRRKDPPKEFWRHPYTLYIFLAYNYSMELHDWPKAKRAFLAAAGVEGAPGYLQDMKLWLYKPGSETMLARKTLIHLISTTQDPIARQKYQEKLDAIGSN